MDVTKLKAFADDNWSVTKSTISLSERVENTAKKGENAGYQAWSFVSHSNFAIRKCFRFGHVGNIDIFYRVENTHCISSKALTLSHTSLGFYVSAVLISFENNVGKGEIACNKQFLLFPQCFLPIWNTFYHFHKIWFCRLQTLSVWNSLKFVVWERVKKKKQRSSRKGQIIHLGRKNIYISRKWKWWASWDEHLYKGVDRQTGSSFHLYYILAQQ